MVREILKFFIFVVIILIFQMTLSSHLKILGLFPDLLLIFLITVSLNQSRHLSPVIGFTGGLIQDVLIGGTLGVFALSKSIVCYVSCLFPTGKHERSRPLLFMIFFLMALLENMVINSFLAHESVSGYGTLFLRYGLPSSAYTAMTGIGIVLFLDWMKNHHFLR